MADKNQPKVTVTTDGSPEADKFVAEALAQPSAAGDEVEQFEVFNMVLSAAIACGEQRLLTDETSAEYRVCRPDELCPDCSLKYSLVKKAHDAANQAEYQRGHEDMRRKLLTFLDLHKTRGISRNSLIDFARSLAVVEHPHIPGDGK